MEFNRRDVGYTLYSRTEEALRGWISDRLLEKGADWRSHIPKGIWQKVLDRSGRADPLELNDPLDVLQETDIPDLSEILFRKGTPLLRALPAEFDTDRLREYLSTLYDLRCKIAHVRGSFSALDLDSLMDVAERLSSMVGAWGDETHSLIELLHSDDYATVVTMPRSFVTFEPPHPSPITNNIPPIDYDVDGGFVGRREDQKRIRELVLGDLHRVVTIAGAGGVGKTALVHRFCRSLLERQSQPFDAIVWVSAKEERLTLTGIEPIEPDIRNYEQLLDRILEVHGWEDVLDADLSAKEENVEVILRCSEKGILLVIDNLETIRDERILESIKDMPPPTKVLITSRLGLGEVERRYPLKEMSGEDAVLLIRTLAREKDVKDLARLPDRILLKYANRMSRYPLAIKWVIGQIALGKPIRKATDQLASAKGDIARFCFEAIYGQLDDDAKLVLSSLAATDSPLSRGTLLHVTGLDVERMDRAVKDLIIASLIVPEHSPSESDEIILRYRLIPLTLGYLRAKLEADPDLSRRINARIERVADQIEEARRATRHYRYAMQDLGATLEDERIAASLALTAYQMYQSGDYEGAVQMFQRASDIAPRMPRLYRNWAFIESSAGYHSRAEELMTKATSLDADDPALWFAWGNLEKKRGRLEKSRRCFLRAKNLSPDDGAILGGLAEVEKRRGNYREADKLYIAAAEAPTGRGHRHMVITLTARADNLRRWGERLARDKRLEQAKSKASKAFDLASRAKDIDPSDEKSMWTYRQCALEMVHILGAEGDLDQAGSYFQRALIEQPRGAREKKHMARACSIWVKILQGCGQIDEARHVYALGERFRLHRPEDDAQYEKLASTLFGREAGTLERVNKKRGYGIIRCGNEEVFAHITATAPRLSDEEFKLLEGKKVAFAIEVTNKGKRAVRITAVSCEEEE
jgi:LuxR family glucitol operon transcriptional activator